MKTHNQTHFSGLIFGILAAVCLIFGVGSYNDWWHTNVSNDAMNDILVLGACLIGFVIFLVALFVVTIVQIKHKAPKRVILFAWAPIGLALAGLLIMNSIAGFKKSAYEAKFPNILEKHINLSGEKILVPMGISGESAKLNIEMNKNPENIIELTRYRTLYANADPLKMYSASRLAATFTTLRVFFDGSIIENSQPIRLAVIQPKSYPDVSQFIDQLNNPTNFYHPTEPDLLVYQYYYYANRVEVAPALMLSGSANMDLWGTGIPIFKVNINNLTSQSIIRLEVNGQALALGSNSWQSSNTQGNCNNYSPNLISKLDAPLQVRWQFAEANPKWHEASVVVPKLNAVKSSPDWKEREKNVYLYFQKNGVVAAQLLQVVVLKNEKIGIRTSEILPTLKSVGPCGTADDGWSEEVVRISE